MENNYSFSTIDNIYKNKKEFILIGLTGKVGSGSSIVSDIFASKYSELALSCPQPGNEGFSSDQERISRIIQEFQKSNKPQFLVIKSRDVMTSFLLDEGAWDSLRGIVTTQEKDIKKDTDLRTMILSDFKMELKVKKERSERNTALSTGLKFKPEDFTNYLEQFSTIDGKKLLTLLISENERITKDRKLEQFFFVTEVLPVLSKVIHTRLGNNYTTLFQQFGNSLRFYGTLVENEQNHIREQLSNNKTMNSSNNIDSFSKRINLFIKCIRRPLDNAVPVAIIIDSFKNVFESNYFKNRYSNFYLISVSKDETSRIEDLLINEPKNLNRQSIDNTDLNERPSLASKKIVAFIQCLYAHMDSKIEDKTGNDNLEYIKLLIKLAESKDISILKEIHLQEIKIRSEKEMFTQYCYQEKGGHLEESFKERGITECLCLYYLSIIKDYLRIALYVLKLYPFFLQDVETCIQSADIFLANNEPDSSPKLKLKESILRYISLMIRPGLVIPTPEERCMQIAYTAKLNSGCISRQVGAVVSDNQFNILSIGWNDVACGENPCIYRNLIDLQQQIDLPAYSDYEKRGDSEFHHFVKTLPLEGAEDVLLGVSPTFCFKSLNESLTREKNPMNARALHGEEKALLVCDQTKVQGGFLFTTSSPCEMCAKNAKEHRISRIYYIEPYPGISHSHIRSAGSEDNRADYKLFEGAIGRAYTQLYTPVMPIKDELELRGFPRNLMYKKSVQEEFSENDTSKGSEKTTKAEEVPVPLKKSFSPDWKK